jgi:hypothetical protein
MDTWIGVTKRPPFSIEMQVLMPRRRQALIGLLINADLRYAMLHAVNMLTYKYW